MSWLMEKCGNKFLGTSEELDEDGKVVSSQAVDAKGRPRLSKNSVFDVNTKKPETKAEV